MLKFLHVILTSLKIDERFEKQKGRKPKRPPSLADRAFDAKKVLNGLVEEGYLPVVKPTKRRLWFEDKRSLF